MHKAFVFRLYPTSAQERQLRQMLGATRFVFNYFLAMRKTAWETEQKTVTRFACDKMLPALKQELEWLQKVDSTALQAAVKQVDAAYQKFFKEKKGYPRFKSKRSHEQSNTTKNVGKTIRIEGNKVLLEPNDPWIGIDVGLKAFVTLNTGEQFLAPKPLSQALEQLAKAQRKLARRKKGGKNREKARVQVTRIYERIRSIRNNFLHKLSTKLIHENQGIGLADLRVQNMMRNHHLALAMGDVAWAEFRRQLEYKATWYGRQVIVVGSQFPSSQLCSTPGCGYRNKDTKDLAVRQWKCPQCHVVHDRDVNAAQNIVNEAKRLA